MYNNIPSACKDRLTANPLIYITQKLIHVTFSCVPFSKFQRALTTEYVEIISVYIYVHTQVYYHIYIYIFYTHIDIYLSLYIHTNVQALSQDIYRYM